MHEAIIVQGLGKQFSRYYAERPLTIMEAALSGWRGIKPSERFWALRDINFTVSAGEMLGIIGKNGAGKSTLLQLIGGVGHADEGSVQVNGRIGALLDLGAGFHSDLTGRENVFVSAVVAGLTQKEAARRFPAIVEFAELAEFIDNPVRTYSTGMQMRLAFAVAVHTNPQVLLVDEFLSVGDISFQTKCLQRIAELKEQGCAIVYISHDAQQIKDLCDRALWLRQGQVVAYGEPEIIAGQYIAEMRSETQRRMPMRPPQMTKTGFELRVNENRFGSLEVEVIDFQLLPSSEIQSGDPLYLQIQYYSEKLVESPIFGISISNEDGEEFMNINTENMGILLPIIEGKGEIRLEIERLDLRGGNYFVNVGVYEQRWEYVYDYHWHVYPLQVIAKVHGEGILMPPMQWKIKT